MNLAYSNSGGDNLSHLLIFLGFDPLQELFEALELGQVMDWAILNYSLIIIVISDDFLVYGFFVIALQTWPYVGPSVECDSGFQLTDRKNVRVTVQKKCPNVTVLKILLN